MRTLCAAALLLAVQAAPLAAQAPYETQRYTCDNRGATLVVTYVNSGDPALAVLDVEGQRIVLEAEVAASGARYGYPSDGSHYVWWTKGAEGMLLWHDGTDDSDRPIYEACQAAQ